MDLRDDLRGTSISQKASEISTKSLSLANIPFAAIAGYTTGDDQLNEKILNRYPYTNLPTIQYTTLLDKPVDLYGNVFIHVKDRNEKNNACELKLYDKWILDSGVSDSICNKRSQFLSLYKLATLHHIRLGINTTVSTSY